MRINDITGSGREGLMCRIRTRTALAPGIPAAGIDMYMSVVTQSTSLTRVAISACASDPPMIEHAGTCPTIRIQRENETSQAGLRRLRSARAALPIPTREEEEHGGFLGYNQKGMDVAKGALKGILNLKFDSGPCQADFAALSKAADKTIDANAIDAWANEI